jgi:hypothetical protein
MITVARVTTTAAVRVVGIVGITTTSGTNVRRMECVGTWSVWVSRRRVPQRSMGRGLAHGTQQLGLHKVAKRPWCTRKTAGSVRLRYG